MIIKTLLTLLTVVTVAEAGAQFTFNNYCGGEIELTVTGPGWGPNGVCKLASRQSCSGGFGGQLTFRNGYGASNTKAELKLDNPDGNDYYDLSVVDGFDVPMQLINNCNGDTITCRQAQCPEAYDFSSDNGKTHGARACGSYTLNFCA